MSDHISREEAVRALGDAHFKNYGTAIMVIQALPSAEPERLTDDDFETIRIHLNAYKEKLCNQRRWKEADEYQRIIDRFMAFASAEPKKGKWIQVDSYSAFGGEESAWMAHGNPVAYHYCSECKNQCYVNEECEELLTDYCPNCGARME